MFQLYEDLVAAHASKQYERTITDEPTAVPKAKDEYQPSEHDLRLTPDPNCEWCKKTFRDPEPSQLTMYLHALSYKVPAYSSLQSVL